MRIPIESSTSYRGRNSRPNWLALVGFIALGFAAGGWGAIFSPAYSPSNASWYAALTKPPWTPPTPMLGALWTVQYPLMGVAVWTIWGERYHRGRNLALLAFALQLVLNSLWAPVLFGAKDIGLGLWVISGSWLALAWTVLGFSRVRIGAACLMLPCLAWTGFAAALNLAIWRYNP